MKEFYVDFNSIMIFDDYLVTEIRSEFNSNFDLESMTVGEKIVAIDDDDFKVIGTFVRDITQEGWPFSPFAFGIRFPRARSEQKHL